VLAGPANSAGRIWIFGTGLALLCTAMLSLLRHGCGVHGLRRSCVGVHVMMSALVVALTVGIGWPKAMANPQIPLGLGLLVAEAMFSLAKNP